jgi:hypothetical protein
MPTKREREYYAMGYRDGRASTLEYPEQRRIDVMQEYGGEALLTARPKPKRKLSAWNKYVKNPRNHITYRDGKLNLKKMGVAFRRKKRR